MSKDKNEKAVEKYYSQSPEEAKKYYEAHRGSSDADADNWERNVNRSEGQEYLGGEDDDD